MQAPLKFKPRIRLVTSILYSFLLVSNLDSTGRKYSCSKKAPLDGLCRHWEVNRNLQRMAGVVFGLAGVGERWRFVAFLN